MTWTTVSCPFDGTELPIEIAFTGDFPMLNVNCPELVAHMKNEHGDL